MVESLPPAFKPDALRGAAPRETRFFSGGCTVTFVTFAAIFGVRRFLGVSAAAAARSVAAAEAQRRPGGRAHDA
jgi:hypothetical protein